MIKPYLKEEQCSWWCSAKPDVYMYYLHPTSRFKVTAEIRPYCASCATFLIRDTSDFHKPFKHDVFLALITKRLLYETL
jgi:hypothetical protein